MTVQEALNYSDDLKPNAFSEGAKLRWLNELEGRIQLFVLGTPEEALRRYTLPEDAETELLADSPHDRLYWTWLCAMVDFGNGEYDKYQNAMAMHNEAYGEFARWHQRTRHSCPKRPLKAF